MSKENKDEKKDSKKATYRYEAQPMTYYTAAIGGQFVTTTRIEHRRVRND